MHCPHALSPHAYQLWCTKLSSQHPTHLDGIAKDEMRHHGVSDEHHASHDGKMNEVGTGQPEGAGHNAQARLKVHQLENARNEQEDVNAVERKVPVGRRWE